MSGPVNFRTVPPHLSFKEVLNTNYSYMMRQCDKLHRDSMLCSLEDPENPEKCRNKRREAIHCTVDLYSQMTEKCAASFREYRICIVKNSVDEYDFGPCRKQKEEFDNCVMEKLGWKRPEQEDLTKVTKVATSRPLPENPYQPEANPVVDAPLKPGSRLFFWNW